MKTTTLATSKTRNHTITLRQTACSAKERSQGAPEYRWVVTDGKITLRGPYYNESEAWEGYRQEADHAIRMSH